MNLLYAPMSGSNSENNLYRYYFPTKTVQKAYGCTERRLC